MGRRGRAVANGVGFDVAYTAGDFTGGGTLVWTVDSGEVGTFRYTFLAGKTMLIWFTLNATTISGVGADLRIKVPGGYTVARTVRDFMNVAQPGFDGVGVVIATAATTRLDLYCDLTFGTT